MEEVGRKE